MIVAVCLNPALDITYAVDALTPGETHPVTAVRERAGGKGVNVARVLHALGEDVALVGFAGGATGARLRAELAASGLAAHLVEVDAETRRTVTVTTASDATVLREPGPSVDDVHWRALQAMFDAVVPSAAVVVLSGSLPPGAPDHAYARLSEAAAAAGAAVIVDAGGAALRAALPTQPTIAKPNRAELEALVGHELVDEDELRAALAAVRAAGAASALVSLGEAGVLAAADGGVWRARCTRPIAGNATGAGDALAAALARACAHELAWPDALADAVAVAGAAVCCEVAGELDPAAAAELRPFVHLEQVG